MLVRGPIVCTGVMVGNGRPPPESIPTAPLRSYNPLGLLEKYAGGGGGLGSPISSDTLAESFLFRDTQYGDGNAWVPLLLQHL